MPAVKSRIQRKTVLLVEGDVVVRLALADRLRGCGHVVIEAATGQEARTVLLAGPPVGVVLADAAVAGPDNGFALATWIRRHRPKIAVTLTGSLTSKAQAAHDLCGDGADASILLSRIQTMLAERKRRARPPTAGAPAKRRRVMK